MRIAEIVHSSDQHQRCANNSEQRQFNTACHAIASHDWPKAHKIMDRLAQTAHCPSLRAAAQQAAGILDPQNSTDETAGKLLELLPGGYLQVFGNKRERNTGELK